MKQNTLATVIGRLCKSGNIAKALALDDKHHYLLQRGQLSVKYIIPPHLVRDSLLYISESDLYPFWCVDAYIASIKKQGLPYTEV